jgi:prefoldin subunit 5
MVDDNSTETVEPSGPMDLSAGIAAYARSLNNDGKEKSGSRPSTDDIKPPAETFDADDEDDEDTDPEAAEDFEPVDDEDEDEGQSLDEDEAPEPEPPAAQYADDKARVRLEDGTEVTVADLRKGTLLQADYSRKTETLAKEREVVASEREQTQQYATRVHDDRMYLARIAQATLPQPPPQSMLNPASPDYNQTLYHQWKAQYEQKMHELGTIDAQIAAYDQQIASESQKHFLETRQSEGQKLLERVPEFKDPTFQKRFWRDAIKAGNDVYGFTQAEVEALNDHRDFMVLNDALKWQRLKAKQARAAKKSDGKPQITMHGGTRRSPQEIAESNRRAAMKRLEKTGSMQDGIRAYLASQRD